MRKGKRLILEQALARTQTGRDAPVSWGGRQEVERWSTGPVDFGAAVGQAWLCRHD